MVISFQEKDRKRIEATGKNIIQVKQVLYKFQKLLNNVLNYFRDLTPEQKKQFLKSVLEENRD